MMDTDLGPPLNTSPLLSVGTVGARQIFVIAELHKNGEILAKFTLHQIRSAEARNEPCRISNSFKPAWNIYRSQPAYV